MIEIEATKIARDLGNPRMTNIVIFGYISSLLKLFSLDAACRAIGKKFENKSLKIKSLNQVAVKTGAEIFNS